MCVWVCAYVCMYIYIYFQGGYMNAKKTKLDEQTAIHNKEEGIFKGVSIFVNGFTSKFIQKCRAMMDKQSN